MKSLNEHKESLNEGKKVKLFKKVKPGDIAIDYNNDSYKVIATGKAKDLSNYDDSGVANELDPNEIAIAVKGPDGTAVYAYDGSGAVVYEAINNYINEELSSDEKKDLKLLDGLHKSVNKISDKFSGAYNKASTDEITDILDDLETEIDSIRTKLGDTYNNLVDKANESRDEDNQLDNSLNEMRVLSRDYIDQMEGMANVKDLEKATKLVRSLRDDWLKEGFERGDAILYFTRILNTNK